MDIEGILAVGGFWIFLILLVFRGAIRERLSKAEGPLLATNKGEISEMKARLATLEARVTAMNHEIMELQDGADFDRKLLGKNEKENRVIPSAGISSAKALTTSPSALRKPGLPPR